MKKLIPILILTLLSLSMGAFALDNIPLPTDGSFYDGAVIAGRTDTNVVTVSTAYTPRRIGDLLIGGAGAGTGAVWVAKGKTTNDWVQAGSGTDMGTVSAAIAAAVAAQSDTNVTSQSTAYTPRHKGDTLVGGAGSGTNAVWISKGTTTNDWVQVKP